MKMVGTFHVEAFVADDAASDAELLIIGDANIKAAAELLQTRLSINTENIKKRYKTFFYKRKTFV